MIFLVAEIGVNWDGDFNLAREMMEVAKKTGCNAVKFQAYKEETVKSHPEANRLIKAAISKTNIEKIDDIAKNVGIEWFCTPMYVEAVDFLDPYVKRFKIREIDGRTMLKNEISPLLDRILKTKKEVIVSSQISPRPSKFFNDSSIKWLYCVPKYPCSIEDLDFTEIKDFNGFSNHSTDLVVPLTAAILGAKMIEVHITSDKSKNFVDNNVSLDYEELRNLIRMIRLSEQIKK